MVNHSTGRDGVWSLLDLTRIADFETLEGYLRRMLELCSEVLGAQGATIFLLDEASHRYVLVESTGTLATAPPGASFEAGQGIAGQAVVKGKPMLIVDPSDSPDLAGLTIDRRREIGSSMVVPLLTHHGDGIGVLNLARPADRPPFGDVELAHAASFAYQIALAVSNARLFVRANLALYEEKAMHEKLKAVLETVGFGVIVVSGGETISEVNHAAEELLGIRDWDGLTFRHFLDRAPEFIKQALRDAVEESRRDRHVHRRVSEYQGRAWLVVSRPLSMGGLTIALEDLTELELTQQRLAESQRLAAVGTMTAAIAHEIRNPLTGIRSAAQMIESQQGDPVEFATIVRQEAEKLNILCDQFLDFARPMQLTIEPTALSAIAERVALRLKSEAEAARVTLRMVGDGAALPCACDPLRVEQILHNVVQNAIQACEQGGNVTIKIVGTTIEVTDDGIGMSQETAEQLFTPFFTTKANGTGLGMSNVKKIIDAHMATIAVQSQVGSGTTFTITFPEIRAA